MLDSRLSGALSAILLFALPFASSASPSVDWKNAALEIVGKYEGGGYGQVTPDSDCQGLSLGIEQHTVAQGSILNVINEIATSDFDASVQRYLHTSKAVFLEIVDLMRAGRNAEARVKSHELQDTKQGKCRDGTVGVKMHDAAERELREWLLSPKVVAAQRKAAEEKQETSFKVMECLLRKRNQNEPLRFGQFLFVYGWYVQGGKNDLESRYLESATENVIRNYKSYQITERRNIELKINYLADWFAARWTNTQNEKYFEDAKFNSDALRKLAPTIGETDVRLLYMRQFRASMGNIPYQLTFMNRGFIDLLGNGRVNSRPFDHTAIFQKMGNASDADRSSVNCAP